MTMNRLVASGLFTACAAVAGCAQPPAAAAPLSNTAAPARAVGFSETVFGVSISDPYRWMEDPTNAPSMVEWVRAASTANMQQIAALPGRNALRDALLAASNAGIAYRDTKAAGSRIFALRLDPDSTIYKLVVREPENAERVLFDPALASGAKSVTIDSYSPSPTGSFVAVHTAEGGGEVGPIRFLDVATGGWRDDVIEPVWGEFLISWLDESTALFTRMGDGKSRDPLQGMEGGIHRLGRPAGEDTVLMTPPPPSDGVVQATEMPLLLAHAQAPWVTGAFVGASPESRVLIAPAREIRAGRSPWREVAKREDHINSWDVLGGSLYVITTKTAPTGEVQRIDADKGTAADAESVLPASDTVFSAIYAAVDGLYVLTLKDGINGLLFLPDGRPPARQVALEPASIGAISAAGDGRGIVFGVTTWTRAARFFRAEAGVAREIGITSASYTGADKMESQVTDVTSTDGTQVPLTIVGLKGRQKTGRAPTLLDAYGGYGIPYTPSYEFHLFPWIERGGIFAVCGVRGGGEKGRAWHEAGRLANKAVGHADLIACAEHLVRSKETDSAHLAATGTSAGGMMAPPTALKQPDLFRAVLSRVGLVNPTRLAVAENGPNQFRELGDPQTEAGLKALLASDAYLMLDRSTKMPDWFITVGLNDHRVAPWMNAKFAAKAMAKAGSQSLAFVRADADVGHGIGSTRAQQAEEWADAFSFLLNRFGDPEFQRPGSR